MFEKTSAAWLSARPKILKPWVPLDSIVALPAKVKRRSIAMEGVCVAWKILTSRLLS